MSQLTFDDRWHILAEHYNPNELNELLKTDPAITRRPYLHIVAKELLRVNSDNVNSLTKLVEAMLATSPLGHYYERFRVELEIDPDKFPDIVERFHLELIHVIHPKYKSRLVEIVAKDDLTTAKYIVLNWIIRKCKSLIPIAKNIKLSPSQYEMLERYALELAEVEMVKTILTVLYPGSWCVIT